MGRKRKHTTNTFRELVTSLTNSEYSCIGEYVRADIPTLFRHNICGHEWRARPNGFISNNIRCPHCYNLRRVGHTKDTEEFKNDVFEQVGNEYTVVGEYVDSNTPILMRHNTCGHEWKIKPSFFLGKRQNRCPRCNRGPVSKEDALQRFSQKWGQQYEIIDYGGTLKAKSQIKRKQCGHVFTTSVQTALLWKSSYCPVCSNESKKQALQRAKRADAKRKNKRKEIESNDSYLINWDNDSKVSATLTCKHCGKSTHLDKVTLSALRKKCLCQKKSCHTEEELRYRLSQYSNTYTLIGEYKDGKTPALFRHKKCNTEFLIPPSRLLTYLRQGKDGCPNCMGKRGIARTKEQYQKELNTIYGINKFIVLEDYKDLRTPCLVRHECGHEYAPLPETLLGLRKGRTKESGCPACSSPNNSNGTKKIQTWLEEHNIRFQREYRIAECHGQLPLPFDFAVFDKNDALVGLIEYDGEQHFKPIDMFGGETDFQRRRENDFLKDAYAIMESPVPLIRISYRDYDKINTLLNIRLANLIE